MPKGKIFCGGWRHGEGPSRKTAQAFGGWISFFRKTNLQSHQRPAGLTSFRPFLIPVFQDHNLVHPWVKISAGSPEYHNPNEDRMDKESLKNGNRTIPGGKEPISIYREFGRTKPPVLPVEQSLFPKTVGLQQHPSSRPSRPRYIKNDGRFYSFPIIDLCAIGSLFNPCATKRTPPSPEP